MPSVAAAAKTLPPEVRLALAYAAGARTQATQDAVDRALEWTRYKSDLVGWVDECCTTYDPRFGPDGRAIGWVPFKLYPFQREYLQWLETRYLESSDVFTEKSRDMGVSWCVIAWLAHHWLFDDAFQALVGSYTEALTDNFLHDSIFGKLEGLIERLPAWQREAAGWAPSNPDCRKHLAIRNRRSGNTIGGQSANPRFGRQGRYSAMLLDEFSMWPQAEQVLAASADACPFRCFVATPKGMNSSGRLRHSGRVKVMTLHWRLHPHKDEAWYAAECLRRTPEEVAQELDISYDKSVQGRVLPEWDRVPGGDFPYVRGWPLYVSWDFGLDDATAIVWWQKNPTNGLFRAIDCYSNSGPTIGFYVPFVTGELSSGLPYGYSEDDLAKVESHRGWGVATHYGDPAGGQRNQVTGSSVITELRRAGVYVNTRPDRNTFRERWQTTKLFLRQLEGWNRATCLPLHDALTSARFPTRDPDATYTTENALPIHDWTSHLRTSVEYLAVNVYGLEERDAVPRAAPQPSAFMLRSSGSMSAERAWLRKAGR